MKISIIFPFLILGSLLIIYPVKGQSLASLDVSEDSYERHPPSITSLLPIHNMQADVPVGLPPAIGSLQNWLLFEVDYPEIARENGREGRVVLRFVIDEMGQINQLSLVKGVGLGCDEAALAAVRKIPRWTPAQKNGEAIAVVCYLPIDFRLR